MPPVIGPRRSTTTTERSAGDEVGSENVVAARRSTDVAGPAAVRSATTTTSRPPGAEASLVATDTGGVDLGASRTMWALAAVTALIVAVAVGAQKS